MRTIYLIRHGRTEANEKNLYYGKTDLPLSEAGIAELKELARTGNYPTRENCVFFTSSLQRTTQTLEILYPSAEYSVEPLLDEMNFGVFEMRHYDELKNDVDFQKWIIGDNMKNICPGGESYAIHEKRSLEGLFKILKNTTQNVILICHGGTLMEVMSALFPNEGDNRWYWSRQNGHGFAIHFDGNRAVSWREVPKSAKIGDN